MNPVAVLAAAGIVAVFLLCVGIVTLAAKAAELRLEVGRLRNRRRDLLIACTTLEEVRDRRPPASGQRRPVLVPNPITTEVPVTGGDTIRVANGHLGPIPRPPRQQSPSWFPPNPGGVQ